MNREEQRALLIAEAKQPGRKEISAMIRVKNEEEFLSAAVHSILELVDEVVLIDNLSSDTTPQIICELKAAYPEKVRTFSYPYEILKVGKETWDYSTNPAKRNSPHLSANFYTWCLARCSRPYILKWDADMIALENFTHSLARWQQEKKPVLSFFGLNVHPNRSCYLAPRCTDRERLLAQLIEPTLPWWVTVLTRDSLEPRVFPHRFTCFGLGKHWTQGLDTPCLDRGVGKKLELRLEDANFLHLKFCKQDPLANYSSDLKQVIAANIMEGPPLDGEARVILEQYDLLAQAQASFALPQ
jgi:hypothetical protein